MKRTKIIEIVFTVINCFSSCKNFGIIEFFDIRSKKIVGIIARIKTGIAKRFDGKKTANAIGIII
jgi:hypothetical protein